MIRSLRYWLAVVRVIAWRPPRDAHVLLTLEPAARRICLGLRFDCGHHFCALIEPDEPGPPLRSALAAFVRRAEAAMTADHARADAHVRRN